jgi:lipoprotein-anchoring transpeptidase ErfK/SrfK
VGRATSWSHQAQVLLVLGSATVEGQDYVHLLLPIRPTGTSGWVPLDTVRLSHTRYWVTVGTQSRRVTVYLGGRRRHSYRAVVGKRATPSPAGLAAVYERNRQPDPRGFLGPWALTLTALSKSVLSFGGGPGRVAIHGRAGASLRDPLGSARSHGCIRIENQPIVWMARHLPAGTPVDIRR